jgi:hypothetical protein
MLKREKFLLGADNHGDEGDEHSLKAILEFKKDFRPTIIGHLGDCWDFRNLRKGASDDERAESLSEDWEAGECFLNHFLEGAKQAFFLRGNHDERLWYFRESATGLLRDYAGDGIKRVEAICRKLKAKMLPYDSALGVYKLGHLSLIHGYHAGLNAAAMHAKVYGNCCFGHVHSQETTAVPSLVPAEARSIGCLCNRDMGYINAKTGKLRWAQGWAYGYLFEDGTYQLFMTRKINGNFYTANEIKTY